MFSGRESLFVIRLYRRKQQKYWKGEEKQTVHTSSFENPVGSEEWKRRRRAEDQEYDRCAKHDSERNNERLLAEEKSNEVVKHWHESTNTESKIIIE